MRTRLHFLKKLNLRAISKLAPPETAIVFYDRRLLSAVPGFRNFLKSFPHAFALTAGEGLKTLESFSAISRKVHLRVGENATRTWTVLAIGGGSVGDFGGFFASVYKRGLRLVHLPTTWLAAIDSSHGGKTALNLSGAKNQIGTFYPAVDTILVHSVLRALPLSNVEDAIGEFLKISLINGGLLARVRGESAERAQMLWRFLPRAIEAKMRIVRSDPIETKGARQVLNLGHTFGHVLEMELGLSHGRSVALGLLFALDFSETSGALSPKSALSIRQWLRSFGVVRDVVKDRVLKSKAQKLLRSDKKRDHGDFVWFIVIRGLGRVERKRVAVSQIMAVVENRGWLR